MRRYATQPPGGWGCARRPGLPRNDLRRLLDARHDDLVPTYAEWVSTAALALSTALAVHQVRASRRDAPRILLLVDAAANWQADTVTVGIRVVNDGSRPVTISAAGWEVRGSPDLARAAVTVGGSEPLVPALPHRLDANDDVTWRWPPWLTEHLVDVDAFRPFVDVHGLRQLRRLPRLRGRSTPEVDRRHYPPGKQWIEPRLLTAMRDAMDDARQEAEAGQPPRDPDES